MGPQGTYSHQALTQEFEKYKGEYDIEYYPQSSIDDCFKFINAGKCDYSLVPFENSSNGQVIFTYDLLRDWYCNKQDWDEFNGQLQINHEKDQQPLFRVIGEQFVSIHHFLISYAKSLKDIKTIYSHPQVWSQCDNFFKTQDLNKDLEKIDTSSTSRAVEIVSKLDPILMQEAGAIAGSLSAEIHDVPILMEQVEDNRENTTRFLILGYHNLPLLDVDIGKASVEKMTLLSFILKSNNDYGSLCSSLLCFSSRNLNLLSITTRPSKIKPWLYVFFIEVLTRTEQDSINLQMALDNLDEYVSDKVVIGEEFRRDMRYWKDDVEFIQ